jgi:LacI family transcriptional regulator
MAKGSATIYDVADVACVSIATVSRVLNGSAQVRPETRDRVDAAVKKLNFVPSPAARSLSGGRRWSIGLAYPLEEDRHSAFPIRDDDASVLYADGIVRGASWRATELGYSLFACAVQMGNESASNPVHHLYSAVDGIILSDRVVSNVGAMRIAKRMHSVHLSGSGKLKFGGTIHVDNDGGIRAVVRHLVDVHGVKDFGFVTGSPDSSDAAARFKAFESSLNACGGVLRQENFLLGDFSLSRAEDAVDLRMANTSALPEVFVCANDQMALGVVRALLRSGRKVPRDVLVTGFDDIAAASQSQSNLTTVSQPSFELGVAAVNMVVGLLNRQIEIGTVQILPTQLMVRESCGCGDSGLDLT